MASRRRWLAGLVAGALVTLVQGAAPEGDDWPQFRGLRRDGVSREVGLLRSWPEAGPREIWRRPIGEGFSGLSVVGDRLYTMFAVEALGEGEDAQEFAAAFDAGTGKELWRTPIGKSLEVHYGNGPRSTPTVDGDSVFVLGSFGDLAALSAHDGRKLWALDLAETFLSKVPGFGFSMSPLIDGDLLIVQAGGRRGSYAGLDKRTGKVRWATGSSPPGYSSPLLLNMPAGQPCYVHFGKKELKCLDHNGLEVWSHEWPEIRTMAMPVFVPPDKVFVSGVEKAGGILLQVQVGEEGRQTLEEVWKQPLMRNKFSSSLIHEGHLYGFDESTFRCISLEDGKQAWAARAMGWGSLILADGLLFVLTDKGRLLLLEASPDSYQEKGAVQALEGTSWTAPTLSRGRLFLRNRTEMAAYEVRGASDAGPGVSSSDRLGTPVSSGSDRKTADRARNLRR